MLELDSIVKDDKVTKTVTKNVTFYILLCNCTNCKSVNMLTKNQTSTLIYIIDKMEESPLKNEFLHQLNNLIQKDEES